MRLQENKINQFPIKLAMKWFIMQLMKKNFFVYKFLKVQLNLSGVSGQQLLATELRYPLTSKIHVKKLYYNAIVLVFKALV